MSDPIDNLIRGINAMDYSRRTVVPGIVDEVEDANPREQKVNFRLGIADLAAGEPEDLGIAPTVPMLSIGGGGFFLLLPAADGDESMGLVGDRASGLWQANKSPGEADRVNGKRSKVLADLAATPFQYTAPSGAPDTWDSMLLGGPAGVGIEVASDGTVTITGQAVAPATPTTIVIQPGGDITLTVGTGNAVNIGGVGAVELAKAQIISALQSAFNAAVTAAAPIVPPNGDGGTAGFTAQANAFAASSAGNALQTLKAKGV